MKLKILFPTSVAVLAVFTAFAFTPIKQDAFAVEPGYILMDKVCEKQGFCSNVGNQICTHNGITLRKLDGNNCIVPLRGTWSN